MVDGAYFVKSTPLRAFIGSFQRFVDMLQRVLEILMKKFDAEKIFSDKLRGFLTQPVNLFVFQIAGVSSKPYLLPSFIRDSHTKLLIAKILRLIFTFVVHMV